MIMKHNNLKTVGMEKGQLYETIISSMSTNREKNAAPIGVLCKSEEEVVVYLYQGSHTHKNISNSDYFVVNLTTNPLLLTECTLGDFPADYFYEFKGNPVLKENDAFFISRVIKKKELVHENELGSSPMTVVTAKVEEIVKNKKVIRPLNRGIYAVIESLIHFSRLEIGDAKTRENLYLKIKEMDRVVRRVGSASEKKALQEILNAIHEKYNNLDEKK
ncbi:DUF447 family protein [Methanobacterium movens]|nr:MAG: hypothetical protein CIT03_06375 [Methanobacterium sp.]